MTSGYYAYILDDDGRVTWRHDIICNADEEAKARVEQLVEQLLDGHPIELWQEARWIATFRLKK